MIETTIGDFIIDGFELGHTADTICYCLGVCYITEGYKMCNLYPIPHNIPDCPANAKSARNVITNVQKTYDTWCEDDRNADVCQGLNLLKVEWIRRC